MVIVLLVGPVLAAACAITMMPFYAGFKSYLRRSKWFINLALWLLLYPFALILGSVALALGAIILCLYYAIIPFAITFIILRMIYYKCLRSRKVKNKENLETLMEASK